MIASNALQVLYQDEHFIVVNKPSGLLVHRSEVDRWETRFALQIVRDQIGQRVYPVHRLDRIEFPFPVGRYSTARYSLLCVTPHTGRKHQIRRHMKHIFNPIVGDTTHGDGRHNALFRQQFDCHSLLLAATGLSLTHPYSGEQLSVTAMPDISFMGVMKRFHWQVGC